ncbi:MAG: LPS-assembly lipoprotein LptE [Candidatus Anoxychlamydiales bacterium]|nr:LPS-assembly lipoprotein LptE [Candidatus Anoxychlamydiales bacterium]NGX35870.1 LPS-assembly lipoprotein LptE [Candidatus Anoxychlamydiales bacterium]
MKSSIVLLIFLLTSCGYHLGRSQNAENISVSVPYISDDFSGIFTNEIIKQVSNSSSLSYNYSNADYFLDIKIIENSTRQIGYKYDRNNQNARQKNLRSTEGRQQVTALVELIEKRTNVTKFGPYKIKASSEFDYVDQDSLNDLSFVNPIGQRGTVLSFSLGQLESIESAKEATLKPLYEKLAKKIVDAISTYW